MIVKSLIKDESKLTLDCAKATLAKNSKVEIEDAFYWNPEVQGAMKLGMIEIVGKPPAPLPETAATPEEPKIKYRNVHDSKICFECIKDYADPGQFIHIPESKIATEREIQNAIAWGMIERADGKDAPHAPKARPKPVKIDEFGTDDAVEPAGDISSASQMSKPLDKGNLSSEEKKIAKSRSKKSKSKAKQDFKPKAISSSDVQEGDDLYSETKVVDPSSQPKKAKAEPPPEVEEAVAVVPRKSKSFGFMDVFGGAQVGPAGAGKKEEAAPSSGEEDGF